MVVVTTLHAGPQLVRCLEALRAQSLAGCEIVVVDNSGCGAADAVEAADVQLIRNPRNVGFGEAVNQAGQASQAEFIAVLNDDAYPHPDWLSSLVKACEARPDVGMCASQIRLSTQPDHLDSAGLAIYGDGTTKQRGHGQAADGFLDEEEVLLPSGCAALYRRSMLDEVRLGEVGWFDKDYFLYGEDADLGLRARLAGWTCLYVPGAVVEHDYSRSAGRASRLKAYYVERNRLYTVLKLFPAGRLPLVPVYSSWRYLCHLWSVISGRGLASDFQRDGESWWRLVIIVASAYASAFKSLPDLLKPGIHLTQVTPTSCSWAHSVLASQSATIERYGVGSTAMACCTRR